MIKQNTAIIIQARMGSTRLPGKIMKELAGKPMLWHVVERSRRAKNADNVIVATTVNPEDDIVEKLCKENGFLYFRGSADNVLERYYLTAGKFSAQIVVRITSDCPLNDPALIDSTIEAYKNGSYDYLSLAVSGPEAFPRGFDVEVFSFKALEKAYRKAREPHEKEHVTPYIWENKNKEFKVGQQFIKAPPEYAREYRLTVDYPEDFLLIEKIYAALYKPGKIFHMPEIIHFLDNNPQIASLNANCVQKVIK